MVSREQQINARKAVEDLVKLIENYSGILKEVEYERTRVPLPDTPMDPDTPMEEVEMTKRLEDDFIIYFNHKILEYTNMLDSLIDPSKVDPSKVKFAHPKVIVRNIIEYAGIIKEIELKNKFEPLPDIESIERTYMKAYKANLSLVASTNKLVSLIDPTKVTDEEVDMVQSLNKMNDLVTQAFQGSIQAFQASRTNSSH
jgi:hypothetical protein